MGHSARAIAVGVAAAAVMVGSPASADDIGSFPSGTSSHVARDAATRAVFPLELPASVKLGKLKIRTLAVRQDDIPAQDLFDAVTVEFKPRLSVVVVTLDDAQPEAGQYDVTAQLQYRRQRQVVTFALVRDTAELVAASSAAVEEVDWGLWGGGQSGQVKIRVGPHDAITNTDLRVVEIDARDGTVCGTVSAPTNGVMELGLSPNGTDLGQTEHTCELSSPQLAEPLVITVSVQHHLTQWLISLFVLLGIAAGYGSRHYLGPLMTRLLAQRGLDQIKVTIARAILENSTNPARLAKLQEAMAIVRAVPEGASVHDLNKATEEARTAYQAAMRPPPSPLDAIVEALAPTPTQALAAARRDEKTTERKQFLVGLARFALLTLILMVTAYGLYADTWIGTWQQIVAVVTWAFALDVTVSAVQGEFTKVRPNPVPQPQT